MIRIKEVPNCMGCTACVAVCPNNAIAVDWSDGYPQPRPDTHKCDDCGKCEQVCPLLRDRVEYPFRAAYIAYTTDISVRGRSSAGGIFAMLALSVIARGGVVFGAAFRSDGVCEQTWVDDASSLGALLGRKYVVSRVGSSYAKCKEFLLSNRYVLYCGTPCQIEGLRSYLSSGFSRLLCVEVGCGGVATEKAWTRFREDMGEPEHIEMTNRVYGENVAGLRLVYEDGDKVLKRNQTGIHKAISYGLGIMPACSECSRAKKHSSADITLRRYDPAFDNPKLDHGRQPLTLVLVRTPAGGEAFDAISDIVRKKTITRDDTMRHIRRSEKEKKYTYRSKKFLAMLDSCSFDEAMEISSRASLSNTLVNIAKSILIK